MSPRDQVRCVNPECSSARSGGRILLDRQGGLLDVRMNVGRGGERYELTAVGLYLMVRCPSCAQHRLNPDAMILDGIGQAVERALAGVATSVMKQKAS